MPQLQTTQGLTDGREAVVVPGALVAFSLQGRHRAGPDATFVLGLPMVKEAVRVRASTA